MDALYIYLQFGAYLYTYNYEITRFSENKLYDAFIYNVFLYL